MRTSASGVCLHRAKLRQRRRRSESFSKTKRTPKTKRSVAWDRGLMTIRKLQLRLSSPLAAFAPPASGKESSRPSAEKRVYAPSGREEYERRKTACGLPPPSYRPEQFVCLTASLQMFETLFQNRSLYLLPINRRGAAPTRKAEIHPKSGFSEWRPRGATAKPSPT